MQASIQYKKCTEAVCAFLSDAGFSKAIVGLSGGIDSALVATICVDALGSSAVQGVLMPGPYSSKHSLDDAYKLAKNLSIHTLLMPINEPFAAFEQVFEQACENPLEGIAAENTQARCRMINLMALSNTQGALVMNTGNKSESLLGYSTLYGDAAGAFAPLGGLYKTEVYELARWRNNDAISRGEAPPIPEHTITKPPSAELSPGQEDEKSIGLSYEEIDSILSASFDGKKSSQELIDAGFNPRAVNTVVSRIQSSVFKRVQEPPHP